MPRYRFSYESTAFHEQVVEAESPEAAAQLIHGADPGNWKCVYEGHGDTSSRFEELAEDLWWDEPVEAFEAKLEDGTVTSVIKLESSPDHYQLHLCFPKDEHPHAE